LNYEGDGYNLTQKSLFSQQKTNSKKEFVFCLSYAKISLMDQESKELLEKTYELAEDNNKMLRKVRSVQKRTALLQIIKTLFVVGVSIGAFYFLQPYVDSFQNFVQETGMTIEKFKSLMPR